MGLACMCVWGGDRVLLVGGKRAMAVRAAAGRRGSAAAWPRAAVVTELYKLVKEVVEHAEVPAVQGKCPSQWGGEGAVASSRGQRGAHRIASMMNLIRSSAVSSSETYLPRGR